MNEPYVLDTRHANADAAQPLRPQALPGNLAPATFPYDRTASSSSSRDMAEKRCELPDELAGKLLAMSNHADHGLYLILLSGISFLLHKYTGNTEMAIGMPLLRGQDAESSAGGDLLPFISVLEDEATTFRGWLGEMKQTFLAAYEHDDASGQTATELAGVRSEGPSSSWFKVAVLLDSIHGQSLPKGADPDAVFTFGKREGALSLTIAYDANLYKERTVTAISRQFVLYLQGVSQHPDLPISLIDLVDPEEKERLLVAFNDSHAGYPAHLTIHDLFEEQVGKTPDRVAVVFERELLTYAELNARANRLARALRARGVAPDERVGLITDRSTDMIVGILAIIKAGGAYVPVDPNYPLDRMQYMIADSEVRYVVAQSQYIDPFRFPNCEMIDMLRLPPQPDDNLPRVNRSSDLAYVIYTSGTTGRPKGVMLEHRQVVRLLHNDRQPYDFNETDVWTLFHSYCFDVSVWEMYGALLFGGKLVVVSKQTAQDTTQFLQVLVRENVTVLSQTPSAFYNLVHVDLQQKPAELALRYVVFGGEMLKPALLKPWKERYPRTKLINMYGITETTVHATYKEITEVEIASNRSNIGKPIPTLSCYILDRNLKLIPQGMVGELYVGGAGVARGYMNNESLTNERFIQNPFDPAQRLYRSGDLARWTEDGEMEYLGRIDHQVKVRGYRIELGEIESKLLGHGHIRECIVIARKDEAEHTALAAYYVADRELSVSSVKAHLLRHLPEFMVPAYFVQLASMPLTVNGKIDRKALAPPESSMKSEAAYAAPRTALERDMAELWAAVLRVDRVGIHDHFFAIGGDSIKMIRLISKINEECHVSIHAAEFYKCPTIAELAAWIEKDRPAAQPPARDSLALLEAYKQRIQIEMGERPLPEDAEDYYPLSGIQQSMVFYSKLRPDEPIYHDQFYYLLQFSKFDWAMFCQALEKLSRRHPILRTTLLLDRYSEPVQVVHRDLLPKLELHDLTSRSEEEQEEIVRHYMQQDMRRKFLVGGELLWRQGVFRLTDRDACLILSFHHAVLDGWSVAAFNRELIEVYDGLLQGKEESRGALKASYKDYVAIQLFRKSSDESRLFWKSYLAGYTRSKLPFNLAGKPIGRDRSVVIYRNQLEPDLVHLLDDMTQKTGYGTKEICFAAYLYLMHIVTTEQDLVTGIVTHDRPAIEDGDSILGCFLNTLPYRTALDYNATGLQFLEQVRAQLQDIYMHEMQLVDISQELGEEKHYSINPLFDALFNYTDFHIMEDFGEQTIIRGSDRKLKLESNEMTNTLFDLEVSRAKHQLNIQIKYAKHYFYDQEIATTYELYVRILRHLAGAPSRLLRDAAVLSEGDRQRILYDFNATRAEYAATKTLHALFEEQAAKTPDHPALTMDGLTLSYGLLNQKANQAARMLLASGVQSGDHVGLIADRGFDMIVGMLAILKAGAAYVPIDPEYPLDRKTYIAQNAEITALLADRRHGLPNCKELWLDAGEYERYSAENLGLSKDSRDLAYIIYTSGSTGVPKGVMIEHHSAVNLLQWVNKRFAVGEGDTLLFITSMCFDLSVYDIFGTLACGGKIAIARKEQVRNHLELLRLLRDEKVTFWDSVPSTMNHLVNMIAQEQADYAQLDLRIVLLSGDWIPVTLPDRIRSVFPHASVIALGGATEATVWSNYCPVDHVEDMQSSIPYGNPIANNYFYILDEQRRPVPYGVAGELYIGGVGVARGYRNDAAKTEQSFFRNPFLTHPDERMYKTGDLGRMLPTGMMEFLGRKDHQVKVRGFRVELGEIESQLFKHDRIREAVVVDKKDAEGHVFLCAYVVAREPITSQELREYLSGKLPGYMVPSVFMPLERLPLTPNGKIDRKSLPEPDDSLQSGAAYEEPADSLEETLVRIWQSVLGVERIGVHDHFFELGGHSLSVTSMALKINQALHVEVPLQDIFNQPTVRELSRFIRSMEKSGQSRIEPAGKRAAYPVSSAQKRMFILHQMEKKGLQYNTPVALTVQGGLDAVRLEEVFRRLVARHEVLRTSFMLEGDSPLQVVHDEAAFSIRRWAAAEDELESAVRAFVRPFDLSSAPLLRVGLVQLAEDRHMLLIDMHHIVNDGLTTAMLIREFVALYEGEALPAPRIQYKDYAVWQQAFLQKEAMLEQEHYWVSKFAGDIPILNLPTDFARPAVQSYEGERFRFAADKAVQERLGRLAAQTGATLYMVLLATYNVLLHKYTGQEDIVVGSPIAGRNHADLESMAGLFVNTLAMRNYPARDKPFMAFLQEVKENALQAYSHQDYPFEQLVEKVSVRKDMSRNPLFDTMFIMQNRDRTVLEIPGLSFAPYEFDSKVAKFDLTLEALEDAEGIRFELEYSTRLFTRETAERLAGHWLKVLQEVTANPAVLLDEVDLLSEREKRRIVSEFNDTAAAYEDTEPLHRLFEEQALNNPGQTAIVFEDQQVSYKELNERSNRLAHVLRKKGVRANTVVGLMAERSPEMLVGIYGILKAGGAYLPIDPAYPQERIAHMLQDSGTQLVLTHMKEAPDLPVETLRVNDEAVARESDQPIPLVANPTDLAYVIYTSGSTGKPKGVMIVHRALRNLLVGMRERIPFAAGESIATLTSISFDIFVLESLIPLALGMRLVLCPSDREKDVRALSAFCVRHSVRMMQLTPSRLRLLLDGGCAELLHALNVILIGGEAFPADLLGKLKQITDARIFNMYGPTETTVWSSVSELTDANEVVIGKPIANTRMYVLNHSGTWLQPIGVAGELCIAGDGLAQGYWNRGDLTDEKFVSDPNRPGDKMYKTGDLARWLPDGNLAYLGRIDQQVKIRGFRIEPGEIEARLRDHSMIREAVVIVRDGEDGVNYLIAYYVAGQELVVTDIRKHLLRTLPDFMVPSYFVRLDQIPMTPNGKTDRKALPKFVGSIHSGMEYAPPRNELEAQMVEVWKDLLGLETVGIHDDFFELGGQSLKYIQLQVALENRNLLPDMDEMRNAMSIAGLVEEIRAHRPDLMREKESSDATG